MKCFIKQLENATETGCKDEDNHILSTLDYLTADNVSTNSV